MWEISFLNGCSLNAGNPTPHCDLQISLGKTRHASTSLFMLRGLWSDDINLYPANHIDWLMASQVTVNEHVTPWHAWLECKEKVGDRIWVKFIEPYSLAKLCNHFFTIISLKFCHLLSLYIPARHARGSHAHLQWPVMPSINQHAW